MLPVKPIETAPLFPELHARLIDLLGELSAEEWARPTACAAWTVKDVAAHLLDGNIRQLSFRRDELPPLPPDRPIAGYGDLVDFLNQVNHDWIKASQRISSRLLVEFLDLTGRQWNEFLQTLDPAGPALFPVVWAGDDRSPNWFDLAREYTERWLHQQHIREAVGRPVLAERRFLYPVLDTFMRALPYTYRQVTAAEGTSLAVSITGGAGGDWSLVRAREAWLLYEGRDPGAAVRVALDQDAAWRLFTKGLSPAEARARLQIEGDEELGTAILGLVAIMA